VAPDFDLSDLVEIDSSQNQYRPTRKLEDETGAWQLLDEYDDRAFWEELIVRMAERDVAGMPGKGDVSAMSQDEYERLVKPLEEKYAGEFHANGIERLTLRNS